MGSLVTIGDFSRASHLTVKTLRHYHDAGLLEPSEIDPDSGYRYYSRDQIPAAQVVRRLRNLRMPVAQVRAVLAAPDADSRNRLIAEHLGRLEAELSQTRAAVNELRALLEPRASGPIVHRTVPAAHAIGIEQVIDDSDMFAWWQGAIGELAAHVVEHEISVAGPLREHYLRGIADTTDPAEWETEIGWPIFRT